MPEAEYLALPGAEPYKFPVQRPDIPDYANAGDEAERNQWTKLYTTMKISSIVKPKA
jgi:hypothetical protein